MEKTYWNNCGTYAEAVAKLQTLIPDEGACSSATTKNKALDRFRRASNCYYDLYNNGLCNRAREFNGLFNIDAKSRRYCFTSQHGYTKWYSEFYAAIEVIMDRFVLAAAIEQGLITEVAHVEIAELTF